MKRICLPPGTSNGLAGLPNSHGHCLVFGGFGSASAAFAAGASFGFAAANAREDSDGALDFGEGWRASLPLLGGGFSAFLGLALPFGESLWPASS